MTKPEWVYEGDEDGGMIRFEGKGDVDEQFSVYLPSSENQGKERDRAIQTILEALNGAGIIVEAA